MDPTKPARTWRPRCGKRTHCRICGEPFNEPGRHTHSGTHTACGLEVAIDNMRSLHDKSGPAYERWRRAMLDYAATLEPSD
jgi:hypothetical protein